MPLRNPESEKPTAAYIDIIERGVTTNDDTPGGSLIVPNEVRINGIPLLVPEERRISLMADMRPVTMPVRLRVGTTEADIGTVDIPITTTTGPADGDTAAVSVKVDMDGLRLRLAEFLRAVADEMESEGHDDNS